MIDLNNLFDVSSLPVAPEFVETLAEHATDTAVAALRNLHAPDDIIQLVSNISDLHYYLLECYRDPSYLLHERNDRFDAEGTVLESINLIANLGGVFRGPHAETLPRHIPAPMQLGEES